MQGIIWLCFVWENYDKRVGLEPKLVFRLCVVALPALWEPPHEDNEIRHFPFSKNHLVDERKNGAFRFFSCGVDVSSLSTILLQYPGYPLVTKIFLLACFKYIFPAFPMFESRISHRGMSQGSMVIGSKACGTIQAGDKDCHLWQSGTSPQNKCRILR